VKEKKKRKYYAVSSTTKPLETVNARILD